MSGISISSKSCRRPGRGPERLAQVAHRQRLAAARRWAAAVRPATFVGLGQRVAGCSCEHRDRVVAAVRQRGVRRSAGRTRRPQCSPAARARISASGRPPASPRRHRPAPPQARQIERIGGRPAKSSLARSTTSGTSAAGRPPSPAPARARRRGARRPSRPRSRSARSAHRAR